MIIPIPIPVALLSLLLIASLPEPLWARSLPKNLLVAYQSWSECDDAVLTHVQNGANVVIWFAVNLHADESGGPSISGGPNRTCVEEMIVKLDDLGFGRDDVTHLISVGGWDSPHPDTTFTAEQYAEAFETFSGGLYDGLDWDLEGNDSLTAPSNFFSADCLRLMADLSTVLSDRGYIVSMAPPESYLDVQSSSFSKFVNLTYPSDSLWPPPTFSYHGRNAYVVALALAPDAFDFVSIQIYETKSHAAYNTSILGTPQDEYAVEYFRRLLTEPFVVDFSGDKDFGYLGAVNIHIPLASKVVIGLISAGGIGGPITATNATNAYRSVDADPSVNGNVRGFMYWCIGDDKDGELPLILNEVLGIREGRRVR